ncbi:uncharacterized protein E0L32_003601 [Thyridium curvatum]|uniref:Translocator protein n=1 Tax=Thyridium curvatum TaxID=1093900 RepID=A0A507BJ88_9PEZI|nr:uncharacterized protein E0L32_003601 [Thyridium curvatum]TPX16660.1 hypothetical protein E0L32_003601 [Thyridium curvatum]
MTTYIPSLTIPYSVFANPTASVLLPVVLGTAVGFGTRPTEPQKTYMALKQPPLRPPPEVFGPVWTVLYGLMGYAAYRAVNAGMSPLSSVDHIRMTKHGATLYTIQLGLNLAWMPLFFVLKRPIEATVDAAALLGVNAYLAYLWGSVDKVAGWCMVPYLGWLGFATYLSAGAGYLNNWDFKNKDVKSA